MPHLPTSCDIPQAHHHISRHRTSRDVGHGTAIRYTAKIPRPAPLVGIAGSGTGRDESGRTEEQQAWDGTNGRAMRWTDEMTGRERREERHEMDGTIGSTIGYKIIDEILPPNRHGRTGRGDDSETGDEQGQTARGTGMMISYSIRLPRKDFRMANMYISCILAHLPAFSHTIVIYSKR